MDRLFQNSIRERESSNSIKRKQYQFTFNDLLYQPNVLWHEMQRDHSSSKINQMELCIIVCIYIKTILWYLIYRRRFFLRCSHCVWIHSVERFLSLLVIKPVSLIVCISVIYFNFHCLNLFQMSNVGLDEFLLHQHLFITNLLFAKHGSCEYIPLNLLRLNNTCGSASPFIPSRNEHWCLYRDKWLQKWIGCLVVLFNSCNSILFRLIYWIYPLKKLSFKI